MRCMGQGYWEWGPGWRSLYIHWLYFKLYLGLPCTVVSLLIILNEHNSEDKKAMLSQRWPRDVPDIPVWVPLMSQGVGELSVQLVSKISNLLDHNPPTSQTDRQKHDMQSQDCDLHLYSTSCDKNQITTVLKLTMIVLHGFRVRQNDANRIPSSMEVPQNTNHSHFMVSPKISTGEHRRIRIVSYYQQAEQHSAMLIQITYNSRLHVRFSAWFTCFLIVPG